MNPVADIRRENLKSIVDREGLAVAARRFKKPERQLNDMLARRKSFGEKVAREMESSYDPSRPPGWLDAPNTDAPPHQNNESISGANLPLIPAYPHPFARHDAPVLTTEDIMQGRSTPAPGAVTLPVINPNGMPARTFAYQAPDDTMSGDPEFRITAGSFCFIDPDQPQARHNDIALVGFGATSPPVLRYLHREAGTTLLRSTNPQIPAIPLPDNAVVLGVVVGAADYRFRSA